MCERCKAIDGGIVSLEFLRDTIADALKLALIDEAISDLQSERPPCMQTGRASANMWGRLGEQPDAGNREKAAIVVETALTAEGRDS